MNQRMSTETKVDLDDMGQRARKAARHLATLTTDEKNAALIMIADEIEAQSEIVLAQNALDVEAARAKGLSDALLDRLLLTNARVEKLAAGTRDVVSLPDPVGEVIEGRVLPNGLQIQQRRTPIGVLGVIYEARPNVTVGYRGPLAEDRQCRHPERGQRDAALQSLPGQGHPGWAGQGVRPFRCGSVYFEPGPNTGHSAAEAGCLRRHDHSPRWSRPSPALSRAEHHSGDHRGPRDLPPLC